MTETTHPIYHVRDRDGERLNVAGYFAGLGTGVVVLDCHSLTIRQAQGLVVRLLLAIADAQGGDDV